MRARMRQFTKDENGVSAVELALIAPILVLLLAGIIQLGSIMFLQNHMTNVLNDLRGK